MNDSDYQFIIAWDKEPKTWSPLNCLWNNAAKLVKKDRYVSKVNTVGLKRAYFIANTKK